MRLFFLCLLLLCYFTLNPTPAYAEWEEWDRASVVRESESHITVEDDGSYTEEILIILHIINRKAVENKSVSVMDYNSDSESLEFLAAETINDDIRIPVNSANMEDKPLASDANGFSSIRRHTFPFPSVREGSKLLKKFKKRVKRPPLDGFFFAGFSWTDATLRSSIRIASALPLEFSVNDPNKVLNIVSGRENGKYTIEIVQSKKIFHSVVNENHGSWPLSQYTWVRFSSTKSWSVFGKAAGTAFENVLAQPLPPALAHIATLADKESSTLTKINAALRLFSEKFRYFGDWRPVNGGYIPRSLSTISDSGYGDCKDFATSITAILRSIGIPAYVALVSRSWFVPETNTALPSFFDFNHAIVFVEKENMWLDPTNSYRPAELIPADISSRTALVLDLKNPRLETTTVGEAGDNSTALRWTYSPMKSGWEALNAQILLEGVPAFYQTWGTLTSGQTFEKTARLSLEANEGDMRNLKFLSTTQPSFANMSRFEASYQFEKRNALYRTNVGDMKLLGFDFNTVNAITAISPHKRVLDFQIEQIQKYVVQQLYKERKASGKMPTCKIRSPWIDIDRTFDKTPAGLQQTDTIVTKARKIPAADIHSPVFQKLQDEIRECSYNVALIFQRTKK
jgi:hypothetical protein